MKKLLILIALSIAIVSSADTIPVTHFEYHGPVVLNKKLLVGSDSVQIMQKQDWTTILEKPLRLDPAKATSIDSSQIVSGEDDAAIHNLAFDLKAHKFAKINLDVKGTKNYSIALDGKKATNEITLTPSTYHFDIRYITLPGQTDTISISLVSTDSQSLTLRTDGKRDYTLADVIYGTAITNVAISPDGKWIITDYSKTLPGKSAKWQELRNLQTGNRTTLSGTNNGWMPQSTKYYFKEETLSGTDIMAIDPADGSKYRIAENIPQGRFFFTPDEKSLIFYIHKPGPREDKDIYRILEPDDRQPGWRDRYQIARYDIADGIYLPITEGNKTASLLDVSDDGSKFLLMVSRSRLEKRPTTVSSLYIYDTKSQRVDTVITDDGFVGRAIFSPDASQILIAGSPQALGGIGKNLPEDRIPSMVDNQMFLYDITKRTFTPLTREFDPNVQDFEWNRADGMIYFTAENKDLISLFRLDPRNKQIKLLPVLEENIGDFSIPRVGNALVYTGQSASNPQRLYKFDTKSLKSTLLDEPKQEMLADVKLGECIPWNFVNSRGDSINGRFYLPPDFDPEKKYPLIVNYYGGCSPTSRAFETRYPHNAYAALGYVVYVINPSGATGFGQEFASRHVNTAGQGVADDIIEGTKLFCETHPFVDSKKIGCIGASYGGFMTQYLQTVTDIFAAAVSHAGISDHTSYWGNGYWGYSYSEVSMADSYPWSDTQLYVSQSPLYNADKINTPILFVHGDADHNVPFAESIQLFTALKLLGKDTALVAVSNQDHHILDIEKRIKWQNTIWAWFAKYLQDDPTWWNQLYPPVDL